jgi:hypothetical protein
MVPLRRLPAIAGLAGLIVASPALPDRAAAAEWTLAAEVSERVETDTNFKLNNPSQGMVYGSMTRARLRLGMQTKTTRMNVFAGGRLSAFAGPGDKAGLNRTDPTLGGGFYHRGVRYSSTGAFGYNRTSVAFAQFGLSPLPTGAVIFPDGTVLLPDNTVVPLQDFETITNQTATRTLVTARAGVTLFLDPLNQLSFSGSGAVVRFSGDSGTLVPTNTYGGTITWGHNISARTLSTVQVQIQRFTADDSFNTESMTYSATGGLETHVTDRLLFGFDAGLSATDTNQSNGPVNGTNVGFAGGARVAYDLSDTTLSFRVRQSVVPSSLGELQNQTGAVFGIVHNINDRSRIGLAASYARQVSVGNVSINQQNRQIFTLGPTYTIDLSPDWQAEIGYLFRLQDEQSSIATSNNFFFQVTRSFDLLN